MIGMEDSAGHRFELLDQRPGTAVRMEEYRRLLGYPREHELGERARELSDWARAWFAEHGRPWIYLREADVITAGDDLQIEGVAFPSGQLRDYLRQLGARRVMLVAVSAGRECEEHARRLWDEAKPDEYFFLEVFGSAIVEHLVATASGRLCALAEKEGLKAAPHYSPGYTGWNIADQVRLFEVIFRGGGQIPAAELEVLSSGMLKPKKSLLAVVALVAANSPAALNLQSSPCESCSLTPCTYRRRPYRHALVEDAAAVRKASVGVSAPVAPPAPVAPRYSVNHRALKKWAQERVRFESRPDGEMIASFRFDGTTCSNQGRPLAFNYRIKLSPPEERSRILEATCEPAAEDTGHRSMCAYLENADGLMTAIATEKPLLGRPLEEVLDWQRPSAPAGCHCSAASRAHKWGLALEVIHYALAQRTST